MKKDNYTEIQELYNAAENSEEAMNSNEAGNSEEAMNSNEAGNSEEAMNSNEAANSSLKEENMTDGKRVEGMYDQKEADELPLIRISVRSLVEFILRSGDIDTRKGGGFDVEAMLRERPETIRLSCHFLTRLIAEAIRSELREGRTAYLRMTEIRDKVSVRHL